MVKDTLKKAETQMTQRVEHFQNELLKVRAGKASPMILDNVRVDYYGAPTPLNQIATISVMDARTLAIQPFERKFIPQCEKGIIDSNLGLNPQNDGIAIRVTLPMLTEERRKQLVKQAKDLTEDTKVAVRNVRKETNELLKKLQKDGISEDEVKRGEADVQKLTDNTIKKIDELMQKKEAEIMTV